MKSKMNYNQPLKDYKKTKEKKEVKLTKKQLKEKQLAQSLVSSTLYS